MKPEEESIQLRAENEALREQLRQRDELIAELLQRVQKLEKRLAKDSHNSSLPPSSDRFARQKKSRSLREQSGKKAGGQDGHRGTTLTISQTPEEVIVLPVTQCQHCQADLTAFAPQSMERRQVVDVPTPRLQVREYQGEWKQCPHCQGYTSTTFPAEAKAAVQYGPRVGAMAVYLLVQQLLPWARTCEVLADLVGVQISEGTLACLIKRTAEHLVPVEEQIKTALLVAPVTHNDETGLYVNRRRNWLHGTSTQKLTHYQVHSSRGHKAMDAIGILPTFAGVSVHDCWAAYFRYGCQHALCQVHILRELTYLAEELGLWWAAKLKRVLLAMKAATDQARADGKPCLSATEVAAWDARFLAVLDEGDQVHPRAPARPGKRGKTKQHPARNLLDRLRKHQDACLLFLHDLAVPFDNNLAERDIRMVKVQQKVSGAFRSTEGAVHFCRIRGYVSTLRKQALPVFSALQATLCGQPLLPSF
ncbi:MAG: IS66 family transposase [Ktedonobacteraceae bacterium]